MSHFTRVRTTLRDPALLAAALRETGFRDVEVHDRPAQMHGWAGATRRAEVIVRRASLPPVPEQSTLRQAGCLVVHGIDAAADHLRGFGQAVLPVRVQIQECKQVASHL
jgi:hypothetical protein